MGSGVRTPRVVVEEIKNLWAVDKTRSARRIREIYRQRHGFRDAPSERKFQQIISAAKNEAPDGPFNLVEWQSWTEASASDNDFLLRLNTAVFSLIPGRSLYAHEARWATRLYASLEGLPLTDQLRLVLIYAGRDVAAYHLRESRPFTEDLDGILAYKPWQHYMCDFAYNAAILAQAVPPAFFAPQGRHDEVQAAIQEFADMDVEDMSDEASSRFLELVGKSSFWSLAHEEMHVLLPGNEGAKYKESSDWIDAVADHWEGEPVGSHHARSWSSTVTRSKRLTARGGVGDEGQRSKKKRK